MNFRNWLFFEEILLDNEEITIRDAEPDEIPKIFIHGTDDLKDAQSIQKYGFDLRKFGKTGKKHKLEHLCLFDPKGVYALPFDGNLGYRHYGNLGYRHYVIFEANITKALVIIEKQPTHPKQCLSNLFGNKFHGNLTRVLKSKGYQAVLRPGSEQIILDPNIIKVIKIG